MIELIDASEGIDLIKSNRIKECMICHCCFLNHGFKFQDSVCNGYYDLTILYLNRGNVAIIIVKDVDCGCIIHNISPTCHSEQMCF